MKPVHFLAAFALTIAAVGCGAPENGADTASSDAEANVSNVSLPGDICGKCGDVDGADTCCKGETCSCGMQKGSTLCCTGVEPTDAVYCQDCGFGKGTEMCCSEDNDACGKCGLAEGSDLCCKVSASEAHGEDGHGQEDGHEHGDGHHEDA
ncbi:MAG: hypothetical protein AAF989_04905 [Planctomycetota bacterium]